MASCTERTPHDVPMESHTQFRKKVWYNQKHLLINFNTYKNKILHCRRAVIRQNESRGSFDKYLSIMGTQRRITCKGGVKSSMQKRVSFNQTCKVFL